MDVLHDDLRRLAESLKREGDGTLWLDDSPIGPDPDAIDAVIDFKDKLYYRWYCRPGDPAHFEKAAFPRELTAAHPGADRWDRDWVVKDAMKDGVVLATKDDRRRWAAPGGYVLRNPGYGPAAGARVHLFAPRDSVDLQEGYYYAFGSTLEDDAARQDGVRLYFALLPREVPATLERLVRVLDVYEVPFRFKCLSDPATYGRADAAVLYVARRFAQITCRLLPQIWRGAARNPPAMTRAILPGIGLADDPPGGESFGLHRCQIIAAAVLGAQGDWEAAIAAGFREMRLDAARPWLNAGSCELDLAAALGLGGGEPI